MKRDALTPPKYPVTYNEFGLTGNVWGWIYWWYRNGMAYADGQPTVELRKKFLKCYHEVHLEVEVEVVALECLKEAVC